MWDIICSFMPFSKTFQWEFFKSSPKISVPYVKIGSTKALNRVVKEPRKLMFSRTKALYKANNKCMEKKQNTKKKWFEFPTCDSYYCFFLKRCPSRLSYLQFFAFCLMVQSGHVSRNQSQGLHAWVVSIWSLSRWNVSWFNFHLLWPKIMILVLDELTSRLEEVKNSYDLFIFIYKLDLYLERKNNIVNINKNVNHRIK